MKKIATLAGIAGWLLLAVAMAMAAPATIYVQTTGCNTGSATQCSGTTDSATASASGAAATITCSATDGPAGAPGCSISGSAGQLAAIPVDGSQAVFVNCATNTTQKIFFINAVDDGAGLVGTTTTPTGCTAATSDWGIGGRYIWPSGATVNSIESALRAGDTIVLNDSPASKTVTWITSRSSGNATDGAITLRSSTGNRFQITVTGAVSTITSNAQSQWRLESIEFIHNNATGDNITSYGNWTIYDCKITTTAGARGIFHNVNSALSVIATEITGGSGNGVTTIANATYFHGNYIHNVGGNGLELISSSFPTFVLTNNIIDTAAGRGIYISTTTPSVQASNSWIIGNVVYGSGDSGIEIADQDVIINLINNIFLDNGNAANEFNVDFAAGNAQLAGFHGYNIFHHTNCQGSGTGGPACVNGLTVNSTELTSDPQFVDAAGGNFSLGAASPARQAGIPGVFLGSATTGYVSMGAAIPQAAAGSGGGAIGPGIR